MKIDFARSPREIQVVAARATSNKIIIRKAIGMSSIIVASGAIELLMLMN